ncbi:UDP-2,3-diacylglucosamine diphosphatase [Marinilabiliaceae bacterium JC017]|nr:UDP-2,3-diacylglucosamine diphosphatase [Marinilabiliaceae bacterium JC017]
MKEGRKIYFASDVHLGAPSVKDPQAHEKRFVAWLDEIKESAEEIYLLGDIFDFWFEYQKVVPRGFVRFLGKLAELTDRGIPVHFFTGNHDIWIFDYLPRECGVTIYREPVIQEIEGKTFYLGHGDGLGDYDPQYNFLKAAFTNPFAQWLFARLHPNFGIGMATFWSRKSREKNLKSHGSVYLGDDKEWLVQYAKTVLEQNDIDYFVFGHRHVVREVPLTGVSKLIYLGDWVNSFSYAEFDGTSMQLKFFENNS